MLTVHVRILFHANEQVCVTNPLDAIVYSGNGAKRNLGVQCIDYGARKSKPRFKMPLENPLLTLTRNIVTLIL